MAEGEECTTVSCGDVDVCTCGFGRPLYANGQCACKCYLGVTGEFCDKLPTCDIPQASCVEGSYPGSPNCQCRCLIRYSGRLCDEEYCPYKERAQCLTGHRYFNKDNCGETTVRKACPYICGDCKESERRKCADDPEYQCSEYGCEYRGKQYSVEMCRTLGNNGADVPGKCHPPNTTVAENCAKCSTVPRFPLQYCPVMCGRCPDQSNATSTSTPGPNTTVTTPSPSPQPSSPETTKNTNTTKSSPTKSSPPTNATVTTKSPTTPPTQTTLSSEKPTPTKTTRISRNTTTTRRNEITTAIINTTSATSISSKSTNATPIIPNPLPSTPKVGATMEPDMESMETSVPAGLIAGCVLGSIILIVAVVVIVLCLVRRRRKREKSASTQSQDVRPELLVRNRAYTNPVDELPFSEQMSPTRDPGEHGGSYEYVDVVGYKTVSSPNTSTNNTSTRREVAAEYDLVADDFPLRNSDASGSAKKQYRYSTPFSLRSQSENDGPDNEIYENKRDYENVKKTVSPKSSARGAVESEPPARASYVNTGFVDENSAENEYDAMYDGGTVKENNYDTVYNTTYDVSKPGTSSNNRDEKSENTYNRTSSTNAAVTPREEIYDSTYSSHTDTDDIDNIYNRSISSAPTDPRSQKSDIYASTYGGIRKVPKQRTISSTDDEEKPENIYNRTTSTNASVNPKEEIYDSTYSSHADTDDIDKIYNRSISSTPMDPRSQKSDVYASTYGNIRKVPKQKTISSTDDDEKPENIYNRTTSTNAAVNPKEEIYDSTYSSHADTDDIENIYNRSISSTPMDPRSQKSDIYESTYGVGRNSKANSKLADGSENLYDRSSVNSGAVQPREDNYGSLYERRSERESVENVYHKLEK